MKEHPILFSAPMVRAILEGRKTQTRRVVKPAWIPTIEESARVNGRPALECLAGDIVQPYGSIGDRLWVREAWMQPEFDPEKYRYKATNPSYIGRWRPSIHMPRVASRITLEIIGVRVERLQEISDSDCAKEGVVASISESGKYLGVRHYFSELWDRINHKSYPWDSNPWVWVVEFKKLA